MQDAASEGTALRKLAQQTLKHSARLADRIRPRSQGVVVLIYHRVGGKSGLDIDMPTAMFDAQMAILAASGLVVTIDDAIDSLHTNNPDAANQVVVTFDDGTSDLVNNAFPILEHYGVPSTLYVSTDFLERKVSFPQDGLPMSWAALDDARASGLVTVGAHSHTHALFDRLQPEAVADEIARSDELIENRLGFRPMHFAYPKAVRGSVDAERAIRLRYKSAALAGTRPNVYGATDVHRLSRSPIQVSDGMDFFESKLAGGMSLEDDVRELVNRWRYRRMIT